MINFAQMGGTASHTPKCLPDAKAYVYWGFIWFGRMGA